MRLPLKLPKSKFKNSYFLNTVMSNVLSNLPFSLNHPLKLADNQHIEILKNKIQNLHMLDEF
jgi:hypothetical protein